MNDASWHNAGACVVDKVANTPGLRPNKKIAKDVFRHQERNRKIRAMSTGKNYRELAIRFDLSHSQIWVLVNQDNA